MFSLKQTVTRFVVPAAAAIAGLALVFGLGAFTPALASPGWMPAVPAAAAAQADNNTHKYYDREHKDYHQWTNKEDHAYRGWLKEQHRDYRTFGKMKRKDQAAYWHWRHEHPDEVR